MYYPLKILNCIVEIIKYIASNLTKQQFGFFPIDYGLVWYRKISDENVYLLCEEKFLHKGFMEFYILHKLCCIRLLDPNIFHRIGNQVGKLQLR